MSAGSARRWLAAPGESWRPLAADRAGAAEGPAPDQALMAGGSRGQPHRPPTLRLYTYRRHGALIGRYQNLAAEVDLETCRRTGTPVSRRPTGGGAIIMGAGQLGVALALAFTWSKTLEAFFMPLLVALNMIPKVALGPLIIVWFKYGVLPNSIMAFSICVFPILLTTARGLREIEPELLDLVRALRGSRPIAAFPWASRSDLTSLCSHSADT